MALDVCSLEGTEAHPSVCLKAARAAQGTAIPPGRPVPRPRSGQSQVSAKQGEQYSQVLHVGDASERLPRDAQDLVFAQISKREEKRQSELGTGPALSASHYDNKTPRRLFVGIV